MASIANTFTLLDSDSEGEGPAVVKKSTTVKKTTTKAKKPAAPAAAKPNQRGGKEAAPEVLAPSPAPRHRSGGHDKHRNPAGPGHLRRGKREFDRRSGTGRGNEIKKEGGGAHNWGKAGGEGPGAVEEADKVNGEEADVAEEEVVEEKPEMSLEDFERVREEKRQGEAFAVKKSLHAKDDLSGERYTKKSAEEKAFFLMGGKKEKRSRDRKTEKRAVDVSFRVAAAANAAPAPRDNDRGGRGGRGGGGFRGGRGGARGGGRGGANNGPRTGRTGAVNTMDSSAFPALGGN